MKQHRTMRSLGPIAALGIASLVLAACGVAPPPPPRLQLPHRLKHQCLRLQQR